MQIKWVIFLFLSAIAHFIFLFFLQVEAKRQTQILSHSRHLAVTLVEDDVKKKHSLPVIQRDDGSTKSKKKQNSQTTLASSIIKNENENTHAAEGSPTEESSQRVYTIPETRESFLNSDGYVHPQYPHKARILRQEGTLLVQIDVKEGVLHKTEVIQSSNYPLLDETALNAIQKWQFRPVTVRFTQRIIFLLN